MEISKKRISTFVLALIVCVTMIFSGALNFSTASAADDDVYVLMNIPYAEFYDAELADGSTAVDAVTSATKSKPLNSSLSAGSYHKNSDGSDITGVIYPVKVSQASLSGLTKADNEDGLFENSSYAYCELAETPTAYKEATLNDGTWSFGAVQATAQDIEGVTLSFDTTDHHVKYVIEINDPTGTVQSGTKASGIVVKTTDGKTYGLRHLFNIWRGYEIGWGQKLGGDTTANADAYLEELTAKKIESLVYYTQTGVYNLKLKEATLVPKISDGALDVKAAAVKDGTTTFTATDFEYSPAFSTNIEGASISGTTINFPTSTMPGTYTLTATDRNGDYDVVTTSFVLSTDQAAAAYNNKASKPALTAAEGASSADFSNYISNISKVNVDGTDYSASGRRATKLINEDGTLVSDATPFASDASYTVTVTSAGYPDLTFTYDKTVAAVSKDYEDQLAESEKAAEEAAATAAALQKQLIAAQKQNVQLTTVKISTAKNLKGKKVKLVWKKSGASVDGYKVYRSTKKSSGYKAIKTTKSTKYTVPKKGMKKNKTYYFKVRGYKKVDGKTVYTKYSPAKKVKIKK